MGFEYYVPAMQATDFALLTSSICAIFHYVNKTEETAEDKQLFKREKCTMLTILVIFDSSFVLRLITNLVIAQFAKDYEGEYKMGLCILSLILPQLWDVVPICCVLFIHMQNFKVIRQGSEASDT